MREVYACPIFFVPACFWVSQTDIYSLKLKFSASRISLKREMSMSFSLKHSLGLQF